MHIVDEDYNHLIKELLAIGAHWSSLEFENVDDEDNNLFKVLLTIGVYWSWRLKMRMIMI